MANDITYFHDALMFLLLPFKFDLSSLVLRGDNYFKSASQGLTVDLHLDKKKKERKDILCNRN